MSQVATIRRLLLDGHSLTQRNALLDYGIMALPRRIADLKETGFPISTVMMHNKTTGQRFARYTMAKKFESFAGLQDGEVYAIADLFAHPFNAIFEVKNGTRLRIERIYGFGQRRQAQVMMRTPEGDLQMRQVFNESRLINGDFTLVRVRGSL